MKKTKKGNKNSIFGIILIVLLIFSIIGAIVFISPNPVYLKFKGCESSDVKNYKVYYELDPNLVTYDSKSYDVGLVNKINMNSKLAIGTYNIGIVSVDKSGNESNMETLTITIL